jgi:hypothetical protein
MLGGKQPHHDVSMIEAPRSHRLREYPSDAWSCVLEESGWRLGEAAAAAIFPGEVKRGQKTYRSRKYFKNSKIIF